MTTLLRLVTRDDLDFISEVRHHPSTLKYLHTQIVYSKEEMNKWFDKGLSWYIITVEGISVGYIRISCKDFINKSVKIGCDIHPLYRRKGYAYLAYLLLFSMLKLEGFNRVYLDVLTCNTPAIQLYHKLGFIEVSRITDSICMEKFL